MKTSSFDRSLDYESLWSDRVRLEIGIGNTDAKLIFYQKFPSIDKNGDISKTNKHKQLQLEINLPQETLFRLACATLGRLNAKKNALKMKGNKTDENTVRAYFEYDQILGATTFDTDQVKLSRVDLDKITDANINLASRINPLPKDKK